MSLVRIIRRWLAALCGLGIALPAMAGSYAFRSDTYAWETASTAVSWAGSCTNFKGDDDQATINFTGGFTFSFAGVAYSSVRVLTNGALQFGADTGFMRSYANTDLPAAAAAIGGGCAASATARTLMAYWTDLNPSERNSGNVTWQQKGTSPNRYVVISWNGVYEYQNKVPYAFQIILYESGDIKFQYGNSNTTGSNATIGVQVSDTDTTLYSVDTDVNRNGTALRVYPDLSLPLYLRATGFPSSTMNTWSPTTTTLANYDSSRDSVVGLTLKKGGGGASESDATRYQRWLTTTGGITLAGNVELRVWTAMKDFRTDKGGSLTAYLSDCDSTGANCKTLGSAQLTQAAWADKSTTWVKKTLAFGKLNYTVASGRALELKLIVDNASDDDMWLAYDTTSYPSVLDLAAAPAVDHYELSLPSTGLACLPSTVTVTACVDASSPCTSPATSLNGQSATLSTSAGTLAATSVSFNASGVASTTLSVPGAANGTSVSVTLSGEQTAAANARRCCPNGSSCSAANSCSSLFSTAGFIVSASANGPAATVPAQTAGTGSGSYYLRAIQTNTTTKACEAALTGSTTVNWAAQCNNPSTCSAGNLMSLTGNSATAIAGNPNSAVSSYSSVPMTFDANGNAPFSFTYADVGQMTLWASKSVNSATLAGTTNAFVVKPAGFVLSNVRQTASPNLANPGAASAAGAKFVKAGESFSATVTAQTSGGAATPNFGKETVPEGVLLTRALVLPSGGATGTLSNATLVGGSFSGGVAAVSNLAFSEVGIITLTPSVADGDYLGAGNVTGTTSGNVGRFVPTQFALSAASTTHRTALSCSPASSFTYLGENFRLGFTLTAQNSGGVTTQNYSGSFAKFDPTVASAYNLAGRDAATVFTTASGRLSLGTATGAWSNGVASAIALVANATRAAAPDGPFNAAFGIAPVDSDGVALTAFDMASASGGSNDRATLGSVALRFGRLRLANAVGSQTRPLALPLMAQSWTGSAFDTNSLDSCTAVPATAVSFGNLRRTLTTADTAVSGSSVTLNAGLGQLLLAAPSGGRYGSADVALSLGSTAVDASCLQPWTPGSGDAATTGANLAFLRGAWCASSYDKDPSARATWGLYRGADNVLYQRENY